MDSSSQIFPTIETYEIKLDTLVQGFTVILQDILLLKSEKWTRATGSDFFISHPHKNWTKDEQKAVDSRDIHQWDTPICSRWLTQFPWQKPTAKSKFPETKLSPEEKAAVERLKDIRNQIAHRAGQPASLEMFEEHCNSASVSLMALGVSQEQVDELLQEARDKVVLRKSETEALLKAHKDARWKFETRSILGTGSYAVVIEARNRIDDTLSAIKIIPSQDHGNGNSETKAIKEVRNLAYLSHINVVKYISADYFELTPEKLRSVVNVYANMEKLKEAPALFAGLQLAEMKKSCVQGLYIQTEICGANLRDWLGEPLPGRNDLKTSNEICKGLLNGLNYVHEKNIAHRDLRPENVFFSNPKFRLPVKIGDFGISRQVPGNSTVTMTRETGNSLYRAPEVDDEHEHDPGKAKYSKYVDLYSLGLIMSEIFDRVEKVRTQGQLRKKFEAIRHARDVGIAIKAFPKVESVILQLTDKEPGARWTSAVYTWTDVPDISTTPEPLTPTLVAASPIDVTAAAVTRTTVDVTPVAETPVAVTRTAVEVTPTTEAPLAQETPIQPSTHLQKATPAVYMRNGMLNQIVNISDQLQSISIPDSNRLEQVPAQQSSRLHAAASNSAARVSLGVQLNQNVPIQYSSILLLRKILQKDKGFWTADNMAKFFNNIVGSDKYHAGVFPDASRSMFNSTLYGIHNSKPEYLTKKKINSALTNMGCWHLISSVDRLA